MTWTFIHGDILDVPADVLICSANVWLNLSGGVGGAINLRCGPGMQLELHAHLADRSLRHVPPGEIVRTAPWGLAFNAVLHAVAVNGFYETSVDVVRDVTERSLREAAALGAKRVALTALATGYGRLRLRDFAAAIEPLRSIKFAPIEEVAVCVRTETDLHELTGRE
jgi:O-acetyl-ADP-ribose deacetylase (regulator of RNase III)